MSSGLFDLCTDLEPRGDQPAAIEALAAGFEEGARRQVLRGVTGSGKTFSMANVVARLGRPTLVLAHNKTLAAQLYDEFRTLFRLVDSLLLYETSAPTRTSPSSVEPAVAATVPDAAGASAGASAPASVAGALSGA